jgi:hypothetical protein
MCRVGTTAKQQAAAIAKLNAAGMKAWGASYPGYNSLWVVCPEAFRDRPGNAGRITVPNVSAFIEKFS